MDINYIKNEIEKSYSLNDLCIRLYGYNNGVNFKKLKEIISENNIDISRFDNIHKNQKYEIITKECPSCGNLFNTQKGHKREKITCGTSCYNRYKGKLSKKTKKKISESLIKRSNNNNTIKIETCIMCDKEFELWRTESGRFTRSKTCSDECRHKHYSNKSREIQLILIEDGKHKGWVSRNIMSYPERFFKKVLELNGFKNKFTINHPVKKKDLGIDCNSNYFLDFYFDDIKFDLEIDGKQHNIKERKESDDIRDNLLKENGYTIYRIKWKSINNDIGKKYMKKEIGKLIKILTKLLPNKQ